jgi:hypothetical protein
LDNLSAKELSALTASISLLATLCMVTILLLLLLLL